MASQQQPHLVYHAPTGPTPTEHVRISWPKSGKRAKLVTRSFLLELLTAFGPLENLLLVSSSGVAFATWGSPEVAHRATSELNGKEFRALRGLALAVQRFGASRLRGDAPLDVLESSVKAPIVRNVVPVNVLSNVLPGIPGLVLVLDFISPSEETALLAHLRAEASWNETLSRRVAHFGWGFDYVTRDLVRSAPAPAGSALDDDTSAVLPLSEPLTSLAARFNALGLCGDAGEHALNHAVCRTAVSGGESGLKDLIASLRSATTEACACTLKCETAPELEITSPDVERGSSTSQRFPLPDQVTVNEYIAGKGISAHIDTHASFQDGVCSLSLGSDCVMDFQTACGELGGSSTTPRDESTPSPQSSLYSIHIPRRSLLVLRGEARFAWSHAIPSRKTDLIDEAVSFRATRLSITVRCVRSPVNRPSHVCRCVWPSVCLRSASKPPELFSPVLKCLADTAPTTHVGETVGRTYPSVEGGLVGTLTTPPLESKHVHSLYDTIAQHFSHTRHSRWPRVDAFLEALPAGALVIDVGCGNGKYLGVPARATAIGCDRSLPLAEICAQRGFQSLAADALCVPFRSNCADVVLSIAVIHHLSTHARRLAACSELLRLARPDGGVIFLQAWALEQGEGSRRQFTSQDVFVPWCLARKFAAGSDEEVAAAGGVIDNARNSVVFQRFCHVYRRGELEELLTEAAHHMGLRVLGPPSDTEPEGVSVDPSLPGRLCIEASWFDKDNWCIIARRRR